MCTKAIPLIKKAFSFISVGKMNKIVSRVESFHISSAKYDTFAFHCEY